MTTRHDAPHRVVTPSFERAAFPIGLGFVAGFIDIFGFMAWYGLLAAFTVGAIAGGLSEAHVGYSALRLPIVVLLGLLPFGRAALRAAI